MWLRGENITRYGYDGPINEAYTEVRLKPLHRDGQRCSSFVLATEPRGTTVDEYLDRYGKHGPPFRLARGPREPGGHGAERSVDDGRIRGGGADAVAARPLGLSRPHALRRSRRPGDRGGCRH